MMPYNFHPYVVISIRTYRGTFTRDIGLADGFLNDTIISTVRSVVFTGNHCLSHSSFRRRCCLLCEGRIAFSLADGCGPRCPLSLTLYVTREHHLNERSMASVVGSDPTTQVLVPDAAEGTLSNATTTEQKLVCGDGDSIVA